MFATKLAIFWDITTLTFKIKFNINVFYFSCYATTTQVADTLPRHTNHNNNIICNKKSSENIQFLN